MSEKITYIDRRNFPQPPDRGANAACGGNISWSKDLTEKGSSDLLVRLMVRLETAARAELSVAKRISLLRDLRGVIVRVAERIPKSVVSSRQSNTGKAPGQTLEQRLLFLMVKNLKLALDDMGYAGLAGSEGSRDLRLWIVKELFVYLGWLIEYAVRWNRPHPSGTWSILHELYSDLVEGEDGALAVEGEGIKVGLDPGIEYKRLLLLGLVGQIVPVAERSQWLLEAVAALAKESRIKRPDGCIGEFDLFVVEIAQDKPPHVTGVIEKGLNGWVFEPAQAFFGLTGKKLGNGAS